MRVGLSEGLDNKYSNKEARGKKHKADCYRLTKNAVVLHAKFLCRSKVTLRLQGDGRRRRVFEMEQ